MQRCLLSHICVTPPRISAVSTIVVPERLKEFVSIGENESSFADTSQFNTANSSSPQCHTWLASRPQTISLPCGQQ